jgi:protein-tyrosine kinase
MQRNISLITRTNPKSPISEAYRILRTNVQFSGIDKELKTIVITSTDPREGKSTTISNMAITFAQSGKKILLIDADLRKPTIHKAFRLTNREGLTSIIAKHSEGADYISRSVMKNLDILTCGIIPPNPSELLSSDTMKKFIEDMKEDYDHIFIDTPPAGSVTDAAILASMADATIIVALAGKVSIDNIKRTKEMLEKVNANIIGVVLNALTKDTENKYYYYYYGDEDKENGKKKKSRKKSLR